MSVNLGPGPSDNRQNVNRGLVTDTSSGSWPSRRRYLGVGGDFFSGPSHPCRNTYESLVTMAGARRPPPRSILRIGSNFLSSSPNLRLDPEFFLVNRRSCGV